MKQYYKTGKLSQLGFYRICTSRNVIGVLTRASNKNCDFPLENHNFCVCFTSDTVITNVIPIKP